jgi:diguanylate cyclase (GGDEF)-like protein/PAS domain S-box-containing protein
MHEETLAAILDGADEGFIIFDREGRCSLAGARIGEIFGVERNTLIGGPEPDVLELLCSACEEPETLRDLLRDARKTAVSQAEIELKRPTLRIVRWRSIPVAEGWVGIARDVTRERSAERRSSQLLSRLEQITATDALTQLPNRRRFGEELDREHGRAARAWDSYAVLRIDVDNLAAINNEFGQPRGDEVLEKIAERLREGRREYDLLARLEGDEFVLLIPGADAEGTKVVAQRMASAVAKEPVDLGEKREVTVTIGAAVWIPPSGENGNDVLDRAGTALARAKQRGNQQLEIDAEQREPSKPPPPPPPPRSSPPKTG